MEYLILFLLLVAIGIGAAVFILLRKKVKEPDQNSLLMLQQQINQLSQSLDSRLSESLRNAQDQSSESNKVIREVTNQLARVDSTSKQVLGVTEKLESLESILKNPKQRGVLGEYYLETVLKNVLPPNSYQMQYDLGDGHIVDAVIFVKEKIIPIDSKFSLENYNRLAQEKDPSIRERLERQFKIDLKNRIDETAKYIKPKKKTMDFAFMFIPAEGIYYDILVSRIGAIKVNTRDLIEYAARDKHVIIVSPNSFYAYLQTILQGLRALQIEESAKEIRKNIEKLNNHLSSYGNYFQKVGANLNTTVNMYNQAGKEWGKIDKDIMRITKEKTGVEIEEVDKPKLE